MVLGGGIRNLNQYAPGQCPEHFFGAVRTKNSLPLLGTGRGHTELKSVCPPPDSAQRIFWELCGQKILCRVWYWEGAYGT